MTVLTKPTLVLNKNWVPVRVSSFKNSLTKVLCDRAKFLDHDSFSLYNWEEWVEEFSVKEVSKEDANKYIKSKNFSVKLPEIIICSFYKDTPKADLKLTRRNLLIRDNFKCQYTGEKVTMANATIDHIVPRSRGGKNTWENLVISSFDANTKKGDRTPAEAGLTLLKKPHKPAWNPIYTVLHHSRPKSWEKFINTDKWNEIGYWDTELKE